MWESLAPDRPSWRAAKGSRPHEALQILSAEAKRGACIVSCTRPEVEMKLLILNAQNVADCSVPDLVLWAKPETTSHLNNPYFFYFAKKHSPLQMYLSLSDIDGQTVIIISMV